MCCVILQLTLFVLAVGAEFQPVLPTSNHSDGCNYELLLGRIEVLEKSLKESQEMTRRESQNEIKKLEETVLREPQEVKTIASGITSCSKTPNNNESGRYKLKLITTTFEVFCEQDLYEGGWIVIQNRFNSSSNFFRSWNDYRNGFGTLEGEFWIGLEKIYLLTSSRDYELMIHLEDFNGVTKYAHYELFSIDDEESKYELRVSGYSYNSTAGNSLYSHRGEKFCTFDQDNDEDSEENLATNFDSGWWFDKMSNVKSNLNGRRWNGSDYDKMHWYTFNNDRQTLNVSKMMIRERM